jgi:hypothetical protein
MRYLYIIIIASLVYCQGIKPAIADRYFLLHKMGNNTALMNALSWNPTNSIFIVETGDVVKCLNTHNGDLTEYSLWYLIAMSMLQNKNPAGIQALHHSLWLYPNFEPANDAMQQILKVQEKK